MPRMSLRRRFRSEGEVLRLRDVVGAPTGFKQVMCFPHSLHAAHVRLFLEKRSGRESIPPSSRTCAPTGATGSGDTPRRDKDSSFFRAKKIKGPPDWRRAAEEWRRVETGDGGQPLRRPKIALRKRPIKLGVREGKVDLADSSFRPTRGRGAGRSRAKVHGKPTSP